MIAAQVSRRSFLRGLVGSTALFACPRLARAQALPVWNASPAVTSSGRVVLSSISLNGSSTALSIGDRVILSRVATQVAAKSATRAIANRTMGLVATRMLGAAAVAGPWGLAAAGLGVVAYGAYRYFTSDDEASASNSKYSVQYGQGTGLATVQATYSASGTPCDGLQRGGTYPGSQTAETVPLGLFNGSSTGCIPAVRQKAVFNCTAAELAGVSTAPSGWNKAHTYTAVSRSSGVNEYWVYYTQNVPGSASAGYTPSTFPSAPATTVPASLPADVRVKAPAAQSVADIANAAWQQSVTSSDSSALPWSAANSATSSVTLPSIKSGASTVADPSPGTVGDLVTPRPAVTPDAEVSWTYPDSVLFPDDAGATNPGTTPSPTPTPTPTPSTDWGTAPPMEALPTVTPTSWFPTLFEAPQMTGACSGWTVALPQLGASIPLDPCPALGTITPVVRPICAIGATVIAGKVLLDI